MLRVISSALLFVASTQGPAKHPVVCAKGVHTYYSWKDVPTPFDSLKLPPGPKLMVNSPEEAEAAEQEMLKRAGAAGATGVVIWEQANDFNGAVMTSRRVMPVFVPADSARAYAACRS